MYSEKAKAARRCQALRADGEPCRAYARWGAAGKGTGLCSAHTFKRRGKRARRWEVMHVKVVCHCRAYQFPHRVGGGLCQWPDEPVWVSTIPAGTHSLWRNGGKIDYRALERLLGRRSGERGR